MYIYYQKSRVKQKQKMEKTPASWPFDYSKKKYKKAWPHCFIVFIFLNVKIEKKKHMNMIEKDFNDKMYNNKQIKINNNILNEKKLHFYLGEK